MVVLAICGPCAKYSGAPLCERPKFVIISDKAVLSRNAFKTFILIVFNNDI